MIEIMEEYGEFILAIIGGGLIIGVVMLLFFGIDNHSLSITQFVAQYMEQMLG